MLADAVVDGTLWADASLAVNYTLYRMPKSETTLTPHETVFEARPNVGHLRTFW